MKLLIIFIFLLSATLANAVPQTAPSKKLIDRVNKVKGNENFLASALNKNSSDDHVVKYAHAQQIKNTQPEKACTLFKELRQTNSFKFKDLALIRTYEVCPENKKPNFSSKPWLRKIIATIEFDHCKNKNSANCVNVYLEKSKRKLPQTEKIALIDVALYKAKQINNKALIRKATQRLHKISPKSKPKVRTQDYLLVAKDYLKAREFDRAEKYFSKIIKKNFSLKTKVEAYKGFSKSEKLQRNYKTYVTKEKDLFQFVLSKYKLNKRLISNKLLDKTCQSYSRAAWSYASRTTAENTLDICAKLLKGKYSLASNYWIRGRIEEEKLNYTKAIEYFNLALQERSKNKDFIDKLYWYKAWNERKIKKFSDAKKTLTKLIEQTENRFSEAKFKFWLGKIHLEVNEKQLAKAQFTEIIEESPSSFYSLLSHKYLNKKISYDRTLASNKIKTKNLNLSYVDWLLLLDENEIAQNYLKHKVKKHRNTFTEDNIREVFPYYAKTHMYLEFFYLVSILAPERQNNLLKSNPELLFPQPYKDIVENMTSEFKFNPHIVYSIMRQESAFDPKARSFADAFGLLQLIPEVATKANRSINSNYREATDLYKPDLNIKLGSYYLKQQWKLYKDQFILAAASYNATDRAIRSWIKTRFKGDTLQFIEDIPYEETRNYVKLVMRNYIFYKLINSSEGAIDFPNYCLEMKSI